MGGSVHGSVCMWVCINGYMCWSVYIWGGWVLFIYGCLCVGVQEMEVALSRTLSGWCEVSGPLEQMNFFSQHCESILLFCCLLSTVNLGLCSSSICKPQPTKFAD